MFFLFKFILARIPVLISVAFITLLERKVLRIIGFRLGPNKVSFRGFLQPLGDAAKLANKQVNVLLNFSFFFYYIGSFLIFICALFLWGSMLGVLDFKFCLLLIFLILGFNSLNSMISGWRTFGKFSLIGSMRTVAQLISYEAALYLCLFFLIFFSFTFNSFTYSESTLKFIFLLSLSCFYIWVPCVLAELNRTPYDFSEGESELVSGFNTEFGSGSFTLIFLAEYSNIIFFSIITSYLFFGSRGAIFRFFSFFFFIIWIRSVLPRYRFDFLILLAWKFFIPFLTLIFVIYFFFLY